MKAIYTQLWNVAKPYYIEGRPMDVDHIEWMMEDAMKVCRAEKVDDTILIPLVILHDVGYALVPKDNPFNLDIRRSHMKAGAEVAKKILKKLKYPEEKIEKISYYISIHDNWALGDDQNALFTSDKMLGIFNDLDYMWMATPKGFAALMKIKELNQDEMYQYLLEDEKPRKRPFSTETTSTLYRNYMSDRKEEIDKKKLVDIMSIIIILFL